MYNYNTHTTNNYSIHVHVPYMLICFEILISDIYMYEYPPHYKVCVCPLSVSTFLRTLLTASSPCMVGHWILIIFLDTEEAVVTSALLNSCNFIPTCNCICSDVM